MITSLYSKIEWVDYIVCSKNNNSTASVGCRRKQTQQYRDKEFASWVVSWVWQLTQRLVAQKMEISNIAWQSGAVIPQPVIMENRLIWSRYSTAADNRLPAQERCEVVHWQCLCFLTTSNMLKNAKAERSSSSDTRRTLGRVSIKHTS